MKPITVSAPFLLVTALACLRPVPAVAANSIQVENAKAGSAEWMLTNPGYASSVIEGYASLTSVNRGGQILLFVNTRESRYTIDIFRMGYYGGLGGRRMLSSISRTAVVQPACPEDPGTGLIECIWIDPYVLNIPRTADPTDWMSGIYLVKLTAGTSGRQQYIIFTVRDDTRFSDLIMADGQHRSGKRVGRKSLYGTIANHGDRPTLRGNCRSTDRITVTTTRRRNLLLLGTGHAHVAGTWGYDMSYATNVDVDADRISC
jgi:hypothetical protein